MSTPVAAIEDVVVRAGDTGLEGFRMVPEQATGMVLFAHGSGSSRFSSRNRHVAEVLNSAGLGTVLFDLLTAEEHAVDSRSREHRFDIPLLATRLEGAVAWTGEQPETRHLPIGLFGASTGAAAALIAAANRPDLVQAVVSRGGRPDLAGEALARVQAPTLLIVGGYDLPVIEMNREASYELRCDQRTEIVPGASHLFEEPGTLQTAAELAQRWFVTHLASTES